MVMIFVCYFIIGIISNILMSIKNDLQYEMTLIDISIINAMLMKFICFILSSNDLDQNTQSLKNGPLLQVEKKFFCYLSILILHRLVDIINVNESIHFTLQQCPNTKHLIYISVCPVFIIIIFINEYLLLVFNNI